MSEPAVPVRVVDCRSEGEKATERVVHRDGLDFTGFLQRVSEEFSIPSNETFVLTTMNRTVINSEDDLRDHRTLHLWNTPPVLQDTPIHFAPHYNTLVEGGMYEYYASAGQNSLPYAFAELIDNSLSATSSVKGVRRIDIRLVFDEALGKEGVVILDNGCGMTSKQLNNWAVYRLSKFIRDNGNTQSDHSEYIRPEPVPRSLNSDISFFGVGGKQAVFYIGQSVRMITKSAGSPDVHELVISKEDFERKERNKEEIYSGFIRNRKAGDSSHVQGEEEKFLQALISEEEGKESFTAVVVTGLQQQHVTFLKQEFLDWTRELAHLYHYYIHGIHGNNTTSSNKNEDHVSNIDIQISLLEKFPKIPRTVNLRHIHNDMQTLYINAAADTFEFKARTENDGMVEGILRYHPFLYDRETYPEDPTATAPVDDDDEDCVVLNQTRGKRQIFECYWNGRLIPYTRASEFDWCTRPKTGAVPDECYNRFSGVLFTNDRFQVSQNKLTFMDLELQLQANTTFFTRIVQGQEQRANMQKEFTQWLKNCHEKWDKQVKFMGFKGTTTRSDVVPKKMMSPWATFSSIEWDGRTYKTGQYVKSHKTHPIFYGSVVQFMLYGDHEGDVYGAGGQVQLTMEPKELYSEMKIIPISKIDRAATNASIKKSIDDERAKLPDKLNVMWPDENPWSQNDVRPAGTSLGPLRVEILNKKGESISRMPSTNSAIKKLMVELKVVWHGPKGDEETNSHIAQYSTKWAFWFKKMENMNKLGKYTLTVNAVLNESNATVFAGKQLPSHQLRFSIREGNAESFTVGALSSPLYVGVPFDIPLELVDGYGHPALPHPGLKPLLQCSGLELSYDVTEASGTTFIIRAVRVTGAVKGVNYRKTFEMKVVLSGLKNDSQNVNFSLLPGNPHSIRVRPEEQPIQVENGTPASFDIEIVDEAGNVTPHPKLIVRCQLIGAPGPLLVAIDCSNTGAGTLVTKNITLKDIIKGGKTLKAKFDVPSQKSMVAVQRDVVVVPSRRVSRLQVYCKDAEGDSMDLKDKEKVDWAAGDLLANLYLRLYDEGGREVPLSKEHGPRIKVNWKADMNVEELAQGKLPNIQVPTQMQDEHFYQVSYQDQNMSVDTTFTIVPHPDEPTNMKATVGGTSVRMGEVLSGEIYLELTDQYGNKTRTLTQTCVDTLTADGDGLDKSSLAFTWQEINRSILVTGVRFLPGLPGPREISFTWRNFVEHVRIQVTAGLPAEFKLVNGPEEPLQVLNEQGIDEPFVLQLCDEWGNASPDQRVVVALKKTSNSLKMSLPVHSKPVDAEGRATFVVGSLSGPKGEYTLEFRGFFNSKPIPGPRIKVFIIPDPLKPVKLAVEYNTKAVFAAGETFPVFKVTVLSEEGRPIRDLNPASMSMLMSLPPASAVQFKPTKPMNHEKNDCFYFRDKAIPDLAGTYTIQFCLNSPDKPLWGKQVFDSTFH